VIVRETSVIPARMKRTKLLLQKFLQSATDFYFTDEKVFSDASPDNRQNKVSGRLRELLKKKLSVFFSAYTALSALPGRLSTLPLSRKFLNSLLTPRFVQLFSGNSSVNPFAVYPFKCNLWTKRGLNKLFKNLRDTGTGGQGGQTAQCPHMSTNATSTRSKVKVKVMEFPNFRKLHFCRFISAVFAWSSELMVGGDSMGLGLMIELQNSFTAAKSTKFAIKPILDDTACLGSIFEFPSRKAITRVQTSPNVDISRTSKWPYFGSA